ncbi:hypothetical protein MKZ38_006508 [Zalerion maritima]|uniref:Xylulose kinase n=1 Tax=Zalerion maritima TaxID=339359 RepID=A0AAD5S0S2_9PEZI|nr:hypothetical protein MKZ38_006508 [Zalerion maritima]
MASDGPLYLGFDLSTQQLKAIAVNSSLHVVSSAKVDFDADFGDKYGIKKGVLVNHELGEVFAPVAMWLEAIDLVLKRISEAGLDLSKVRGLSGSCQQHGSVWWNQEAEAKLGSLSTEKSLLDQLEASLSHPYAPNWQDHSTQAECDEFNKLFDSPNKLADVTGSAAHHRFTGPQIMRIRRLHPKVYSLTSRISLVSSFLASVFLGAVAPMDISDVCGANIWDIPGECWSKLALTLVAGGPEGLPGLLEKLGDVRKDGGGGMGKVSSYFVKKYRFSENCEVAPFTGDNPATILALPLRPLDAIVSLGTSTTFLMITPYYKPDPAYHFLNHPTSKGQYMFMLCYKNGGLAREKVRDVLPASDDASDAWKNFNSPVLDTPPMDIKKEGDRAKMGLYFYLPEIVPNISSGTWRYTCEADGSDLKDEQGGPTPVDGSKSGPKPAWDVHTDARIIVESQALSMRLRSQNLVHPPSPKFPAQPRRVYLVGGGSLNPAIARVMGDVLGGAEGVYRLDVGGNACALGGAYKAVWAFERKDKTETFDELIGARWKEEGAIEKIDDGYREGIFESYGEVMHAFEDMESKILKEEGR